MKLFYADHFVLPLPEGHRFPMEKYALLRNRLADSGHFSADDFAVPEAASDEDILRAHCPLYLQRVTSGTLSVEEIRRIGFPWSLQMVERSRRSAGATLAAAHTALIDGVSANLAGGTHHAGFDFGAGFCVFNDAAIAARALQAEGRVKRVMVIDLDVHQGDGTAQIFTGDDSVFTLSLHGDKNFPFRKQESSLDVPLPDGTGDEAYLAALDDALTQAFGRFRPDMAIYLAGADPYEGDRLGRLKLTKAGLAARDEAVLTTLHAKGLPVAIAMAGGYAHTITDTVDIQTTTVLTAKRRYGA
jgi:acetoin utilization deacetylase AcuC-like enzyme